MPDRHYLLLVNTQARTGKGAAAAMEAYVQAKGARVTTVHLKRGVDASAEVDAHCRGMKGVIVAGGDGTLNRAARGLLACGLPLGVVPLGTANDFARTLGLPTATEAALDVILAGEMREIDLGEVNGHLYFNVASVGFSALIARELTHEAKQRWGVVGYGFTALKTLLRARPFGATLVCDQEVRQVRTLQVAVGNGVYYGGGMKVADDAAPDDGRLDAYSLELSHVSELVALWPMLKSGTHAAWPTVEVVSGNQVELYTRRPMPVNADGELVTQTPAVFKVRPKALRVFVAGA